MKQKINKRKTMNKLKKATRRHSRRLASLSVLALLVQALLPILSQPAHAASLSFTEVRFDRMKVSQATTGTVCAKPATTATEASVQVTFPAGYTVNTTVSNWTVDTTTGTAGWPKDPANDTTAATAWPGIATATAAAGQVVTFPSGDLTVGTWYCFNWTNTAAVSIKSSATSDNGGSVTTRTVTPTNIDTGNYATASLTNDQIGVTATVPSTFNFQLSSNAANLGTLSTSTPTSSAVINARVDTNAFKGWNMWAADPAGTPGLTSPTSSKTIAYSPAVATTAAALSAGTEGFNLGTGTTSQGAGSGTITADANFASGGTAFKGGGLDNVLRSLAVSTGTASNAVVPLTVNASISGITPAGADYAATITVVAAGRF